MPKPTKPLRSQSMDELRQRVRTLMTQKRGASMVREREQLTAEILRRMTQKKRKPIMPKVDARSSDPSWKEYSNAYNTSLAGLAGITAEEWHPSAPEPKPLEPYEDPTSDDYDPLRVIRERMEK